MSPQSFLIKAVWSFFLLSICAYTVGYISLSPFLILAVTFFAYRIFPPPIFPEASIPMGVWLVGLLSLGLGSFPLLLITPYFDVSTDPLHTVIVRTLVEAGRVPDMLVPYAPYPVVYPMGFHSAIAVISPLVPVPDYLLMWLMGAIFLFTIPILIYWLFIQLGAKPFGALAGVALFPGSFIFFFNQYAGLYPALFALIIGLLSFMLVVQKHPAFPWVSMGVWLIHPAVGIYTTLWGFSYLLWKGRVRELVGFIPASLMLIPLSPFILSFFVQNGGSQFFKQVAEFDALLFVRWLRLFIFGIGNVLIGAFAAVIVYQCVRRAPALSGFHFFLTQTLFIFAFILSVPHIVSPVIQQTSFFHKFFEWGVLSVMGVVSFSSLFSRPFPRPLKVLILGLLIVSGIYVNAVHYNLEYFRHPGEKITLDEARFAQDFYAYDPAVKSVFYFTLDGSKMSQYANKSPYDPSRDYFIPPYIVPADQNVSNSTLPIYTISREWARIYYSGCFSCAKELNLDYIVTLEGMTMFNGEKPLFTSHGYSLYSGRD